MDCQSWSNYLHLFMSQEQINALGQFAQDMAKRLENIASIIHAYKQTDEYQKNYDTSVGALEKRKARLDKRIDVSCYRALDGRLGSSNP